MKAAAIVLLIAVLSLTASSLLWLRASTTTATATTDSRRAIDEATVVAAFERAHHAEHEIDIGAKYGGRLDLIDPRRALPTWHKHPREEAARVAHCASPPLAIPLTDPELAKAYRRGCARKPSNSGGDDDDDVDIESPPFMHPSGKSYAVLALTTTRATTTTSSSWPRAHVRAFHVLELASLDPKALDASDRALASLDFRTWEALTRGDRIVLVDRGNSANSSNSGNGGNLVFAEQGPLGLARLRIHERAAWDAFAHHKSIALVPRNAMTTLCTHPVSPILCLETRSSAETHRSLFLATTTGSAAFVGLASVFLGIAWARERRRVHRDRIHVLRTLTHELRTPATSLRLDIEPLRAAYDDLPSECQEPVLRISDSIERLQRVLHRSARYMALFETGSAGGAAAGIVHMVDVHSVREMLEQLVDEWPEGVTLSSESGRGSHTDGAVTTDPEWLAVAIRNLVENAARHGKPPIAVTWTLEEKQKQTQTQTPTQRHLIIRVADQGNTRESFSLRRSISPWERDAKSEGLGLGLAIVDRVAHLLGGRLTHESTPTVFQLRLPVFSSSPVSKKKREGGASS